MIGREIFGLATALVVLAGISFAIANGAQTANVMRQGANGFSDLIRAATLQA